MKLSTKGRYGLRAVIDLAIYSDTETVSLSSIAERQHISIRYLEQLAAKLKKAGILNSIRGAQGGYILAKASNEISVGDILRALEGDLHFVDCTELYGGHEQCETADICVTKFVWKRISDSISSAVDSLLLSELVEDGKQIIENQKSEKNENHFCN